ncbi:MAG: methyltransferase domain-containing protein [Actinomycetota bacterium]|jgi:SAM-dependent methyltransferase
MAETGANQQQAAYWSENAGRQWVQQQALFDRQLVHFGNAALGALRAQPGEHILDIGCGTGTTTLAIAESVGPTGWVIGADISAPMIAASSERSIDRPTMSFVVADAQTDRIAPIDHDADAMFSRFGVMFFSDPTAAFTNLASNIRAGGRLAFVCWQHEELNEWMSLPAELMRSFTPEPVLPPANAPGPFAFSDRDRLKTILTTAGWSAVQIEPFSAPTVLGAGLGLESAVTQSMSTRAGEGLRAQVDEATFAAARDAICAEFSKRLVDNAVSFEGNVWVVTAER